MNKPIRTYQDLIQEEQRLQVQLLSYKELIKDDFTGIKQSLNPIRQVKNTVKKLFTRGNNGPLMNFGVNVGLDFIIRKYILAKAGWVTRFLVPFVVKNYTSHIVGNEGKSKIAKSIKNIISKFAGKFKKHSD